MDADRRNDDGILEAELLEYTGEKQLHAPMRFAAIKTSDGRIIEAVVEAAMGPLPGETFRAYAHPSPFKPDHSERNVLADDPSAIWLDCIEILPRRSRSRHGFETRGAKTLGQFDDIEATDLIRFLELRGVEGAQVENGAVAIGLGRASQLTITPGCMTQSGDLANDPRAIRAVLDYARANWGRNCAVSGRAEFKEAVWVQAKLIGVSLSNYSLPASRENEIEAMMFFARVRYMQTTQEPTPALATRNILLNARKGCGPAPV